MTDNTQELDEILRDNLTHDEYQYTDKPHRMKQAILDWHNKQTLELLDRLLKHGEDFTTFGDAGRSVAVEYIEAERKRINKIGKT